MQPLFFCKPKTTLGRWAVGPLGRWAVGPLGRWAVGPLAMTLMAGVALAPRIEAQQTGQGTGGEWEASYVFSGTAGGNTSYYVAVDPDKGYVNVPFVFDTSTLPGQTTPGYTTPFKVRHPYQYEVSAFASRDQSSITSMGGAGQAYFTPTIKVVWDWVPKAGYTNAGPVPDTLRFKVTGQASAQTNGNSENEDITYSHYYNADNNYKWNPADVWNGTATLQMSGINSPSGGVDGELTKNQYGTSNNWNRQQTGLFSIETHGRTHIDDAAPITFDVKAELKGERHLIMMSSGKLSYQPAAGYANASGSVTATPDDRSVALSRGGRYEYSISQNGELHTYGDSIYSAHDASGFSSHDFNSEINIAASYGGIDEWGISPDGSAPYITPSWSPSGFSSTYEQSPQAYRGYGQYGTPLFSGGNYSGSATGIASFVTSYTATDTRDGAVAKAFYHLKLHDPVENVGTTASPYTLFIPVKDSTGLIAFSGGPNGRPAGEKVPTSEVRIGTSTETGYGLTATASVNPFTELLGFSATWTATSTNSVSVDTTLEVPAIAKNTFIYVIAEHDFQRVHKRFFLYDQSGEVRRMITHDENGVPYATPRQVYHEAFRDRAFELRFNWSDPQDATTVIVGDIENQPNQQKPDLKYDYPSGGSA